jgi:tetratricopeptide (TPR) repeat protein
MNSKLARWGWTIAAVAALLAIMEATMLLSVRQESQTCDEAYNLLAGYLHLTRSDFSVCPAYPPLAHDVAALPLLALRLRVPAMTVDEASDFRGGRIFLYANRADELLFASRAAMTVFPLLLAVLVFLATREMFAPGAAFIALALTAFDPNLLAHGPLATNDVALACCFFAAVYAFWRYVVKPSPARLLVCGLAGGLALAAKHSGIILVPTLFLLAMVEATLPSSALAAVDGRGPNAGSTSSTRVGRLALRLLMALMVTAGIAFVVLWGFYLFRYSAQPATQAPAFAWAPLLRAVPSRPAAMAIALAADAHFLPEAYLQGLAFFLATGVRPTYLLGTRYLHGVWFYFPVAFVIKSTLSFLLLVALAGAAPVLRRRERRREVLWMAIPAAVFFAASMTSGLDIGLRHILPIYPFLTVLAAAGAWNLATQRRAWQWAVGGLLLFHAASSVRAFPNYLPCSNELWGGPSRTYRVLTDSNVDWGQGLLAVKQYTRTHPGEPCWLAYFGTVDPAYYGIPCRILPVRAAVVWGRTLDAVPPVITGTVLVSATEMSGQAWGPGDLNPYEQFRTAPPLDMLAGAIAVYRGSFQVPLASAQSRTWKVLTLVSQGNFDAAVAEARAAESLAPQSVDMQFLLGRALKAAGRPDEARQVFEMARHLASTVHPESQSNWTPLIDQQLRNW